MIMVAVPMPVLDANFVERSVGGNGSANLLPVMTVSPVFQTYPFLNGQYMMVPANYEQYQQPQFLHDLTQQPNFHHAVNRNQHEQPSQLQEPMVFAPMPKSSAYCMTSFDIASERQLDNVTACSPTRQPRRKNRVHRRVISDTASSDTSMPPIATPSEDESIMAATSSSENLFALAMDPHELISKCYSALRNRNPEELRAYLSSVFAPDAVLSWPDIAREIRGRADVVEHTLRTMQNIPDIEFNFEKGVVEGELSVRTSCCMQGTALRSDPATPFFRAGRLTQMHLSTLITFDKLGRIKGRQASLDLSVTLPLKLSILDSVLDNVLPLASTPSGSRILQFAVEHADMPSQTHLAEQFRGHVWDASASPHANHILQKIIVRMPPERVQFIAAELQGHVVAAAQHRIRCRVLERLVEHCTASQSESLVEEVLTSAATLCKHPFGNFIVQSILEHGTVDQRTRLATVVLADVHRLAKHKIGSNVVRAALMHSPSDQKDMLVDTLTADPKQMANLGHHRIASFVMREVKFAQRS